MYKNNFIRLYSLFLIASLLSCNQLSARETCSRIAKVNYQDILVDSSSTQKGEGLRYFLEKDAIAKSYLDKYQDGTQIKWENAIVGTAGSLLAIGGLLSSDNRKKTSLVIMGASLIVVNFLMAKTLETTNEKNLIKAINEYNKRNYPKIFFSPLSYSNKLDYGISIAKSWRF
ncbi:hypothetical protein N9O57_01840 [bacterium]|nr:hypothetical protein [bacterium]